MEDLLLILLGLLWFGITIYRNSQKKKQQRDQQQRGTEYASEDANEEQDAGDLLEELFSDSLYSGPISEEEREDVTLVSASGRKSFLKDKDFPDDRVDSLKKSELPSYYEPLENLVDDEEDLTKTGSILDEDVYNLDEDEEEKNGETEFDLRQAVIYSEILKRHEF